ncbi:peptidase S8/S53 domain-containing protein [Mycena vulgaris]|nr:peptidase S8/S53 domain-containing protein [Mycena vulgaris]
MDLLSSWRRERRRSYSRCRGLGRPSDYIFTRATYRIWWIVNQLGIVLPFEFAPRFKPSRRWSCIEFRRGRVRGHGQDRPPGLRREHESRCNDNGDACNSSPAAAEKILTVGASTIADTRASFSNYGPCVDVFAPGVSISSTWIGSPTAEATGSGTSVALPHTAGMLAYFFFSLYPPRRSTPSSI